MNFLVQLKLDKNPFSFCQLKDKNEKNGTTTNKHFHFKMKTKLKILAKMNTLLMKQPVKIYFVF